MTGYRQIMNKWVPQCKGPKGRPRKWKTTLWKNIGTGWDGLRTGGKFLGIEADG